MGTTPPGGPEAAQGDTEAHDAVFDCAGEMAALMRTHDWSATPLGPSAGWSPSLRTAVAILLRSRYPMILSWGPELVVLYNDNFIPTLGAKHPAALGSTLPVTFSEVWDEIGDRQLSVLGGGEATWDEDLPLTIERGRGPEQTFFTFSYSHVPDDEGTGGVLAVLAVTTEKVVGQRRLALLNRVAGLSAAATTPDDLVTRALAVLGEVTDELLGGGLYLSDSDTGGPSLAGTFGPLPELAPADLVPGHPWRQAWDDGAEVTVPLRLADDGPRELVGLPLTAGGRRALLVLAPHPLRPYDEAHRDFLRALAHQLGQTLAVVTARAEDQERLRALAALDAAKTAFLSNVSHEFRTPLTLVLGPLEDVAEGRTAGLDRSQVEQMLASAHRLLRLVNALLDVARSEAEGLPVHLEPVAVASLTADLLQPFAQAAVRAGLRLEVALEPDDGAVMLDPAAWERIAVNLVANALKYTLAGRVSVELARDGEDLVLRVTDTGIGIPEEDLDKVFDRFHRVQSDQGRSIEGSGIGLALVADAAHSLGGEVTVSSRLGEGSVFEVRVPCHRTSAASVVTGVGELAPLRALAHDVVPAAREAEPGPEDAAGDRPVVLVVDDNAGIRERIASLLVELGAVRTAVDGVEAWEVLQREPVDLVLTDVMMPRLDGPGLVTRIRSDPVLSTTPVVMLSARAGAEAAAEGLGSGADDYLVKPFTPAELVARCRTNLELARHRSRAAQERARAVLLAGVSHDMQTPLTVIMTGLQLLVEDELSPLRRQEIVERTTSRALQLRRLVGQFLDWARLSAGEAIPVARARTPVSRVLDEPSRVHQRLRVSGDLAAVVVCDADRTRQILHNLIDNAFRHARDAVHLEVRADDPAWVEVLVGDDGPGVSDHVLPHLFSAYSPSAGLHGSGLGLHISRESARAQGGDLLLDATGERGAVFRLLLPRVEP
jgi:signal transduction histidine kinase